MRLRGGMPMLAAEAARRCLRLRPNDVRCVDVLGRATAATGNCDEALPALRTLRALGRWDTGAAIAEGVCRVRVGDLDGARVAFEEGTLLDDQDPDPWMQRGLVDARLGDVDGLDEAIEAVAERGGERWKLDLLVLWRTSLDPGGAVDGLLWRYAVDPPRTGGAAAGLAIHVGLLACERGLEVGDPVQALVDSERGLAASRGHLRLRACRAEATRRIGDAGAALRQSARPWDDWRTTAVLDAVQIRALVDVDRADEARAALREVEHPELPDLLVSAWYVARARGDRAAMDRAETQLAARSPRDLATLVRLDPLVPAAP
ncbi:MAG: hypothetical protein H6732_13880 [Alphaproteobacteria bacterium]|nr:hypothetical protein [Alphaproteobacteria bacterium]